MRGARINNIRCRNCLRSVWDLHSGGVFYECSHDVLPSKVYDPDKAEKLLAGKCMFALEGPRHGSPSIFDVARARERPQEAPRPAVPVRIPAECNQRHLSDFLEGPRRAADTGGSRP